MTSFYLLVLLVCVNRIALSQDGGVVRYNTTENTSNELVSRLLKYSQFTKGTAYLSNGTKGQASFNYHYNKNEILFINAKNDTLTLVDPEQYQQIVIEADTFLYTKQGFLQLVAATPFCKLLVKRDLVQVGSEKKGAYGGYSATSASSSLNSFSDGTLQRSIAVDENIFYRYKDRYFFCDRFGQLYPATRKGAGELTWKKEKELKAFLEAEKIDVNKKDDLLKLMTFFQSIALD